jgi:hypothetical protein
MRAKEFLLEAPQGKTVVIFPGGFHPFHQGHYYVYETLVKQFPGADVYVAATNTTTERPFQFEQKRFLAAQAGVPADRFVLVKSPYRADEILAHYNGQTDHAVFALSEKDAGRIGYTKKDGSPGFMQPYEGPDMQTFSQHAYVYITPKVNFKVLGKVVDSASTIRAMYAEANDQQRSAIIKDLYPNSSEQDQIKQIIDSVLG